MVHWESKISWNVTTIHRCARDVAGIWAYKKHLTFSPGSPLIIESYQAKLAKFVVRKNCFQLPIDWQLDPALIRDLIHARLAEPN
jgi:uncharacterized protein YdhG (YjbR/CyaY superfamily)